MSANSEQPHARGPATGPQGEAAVRQSIVAMAATLALAEGLVEAGRRIDLAGLDTEIGTICDAALALARDEAVGLRPHLIDLRDRVDRLAVRLTPP